jgi:predicted GNAT family acetyltransferase
MSFRIFLYFESLNLFSEMAAVMYEKQKGGLLNLHHTEVPAHLQNNGIGHDLAKVRFL